MDVRVAQAAVMSSRRTCCQPRQALSRKEDPLLEAAEIVPLNQIQVPEKDDLAPLRELVSKAMAQRPDVAVAKIKDEVAQMNAIGTENPLLPTLQGSFPDLITVESPVRPQASSGIAPDHYFVGGYGNALGQVFRRNFPNNQASIYLAIPLNNRQAQGDYGVDQLQLRQSEVSGQRDNNQIVVDISNQMSAVRQARSRYSAAANTRALQEHVVGRGLAKRCLRRGSATLNELVTDQRNLATARLSEITAMSTYAHARVSLDQVLGETLEIIARKCLPRRCPGGSNNRR